MAVHANLYNNGRPFENFRGAYQGQPARGRRQNAELYQHPALREFDRRFTGRIVDTVVTTKENSLAPKTQRNEMAHNIVTTVALIAAAVISGLSGGTALGIGLGIFALYQAGRAINNYNNWSKKVEQDAVLTDAMTSRVQDVLGSVPHAHDADLRQDGIELLQMGAAANRRNPFQAG